MNYWLKTDILVVDILVVVKRIVEASDPNTIYILQLYYGDEYAGDIDDNDGDSDLVTDGFK